LAAGGLGARGRRTSTKLAGDADDVEAVVAALKEAAVQCQVRLIEHSVAMGRAANAAERLDAFIDQLKTSGIWLDFTKSSGNGGSRPRRAAKGSCHSRRRSCALSARSFRCYSPAVSRRSGKACLQRSSIPDPRHPSFEKHRARIVKLREL
jgi:hypothetical protein